MTVLVVLLVMTAAVTGFVPELRKYRAHEARLHALRTEKEREEARLQDLRVRQERFRNDRDYVKKLAHETGLVEPHEVVFRFHDRDNRSFR